MAYTDFSLETVEQRLGVTVVIGSVFPELAALPVPARLTETLALGRGVAAFMTEKSRSEFIVVPVLMTCRELVEGELTIYSGVRLDVDQSRGLVGECDYILARTMPVPRLRSPLVTVMEAKRGDIELGLGQVVAQMVAASVFNQRANTPTTIYGVITTGEDWQFLKFEGETVTLHRERYYLNNLGGILAALRFVITATPKA
jgi:hypothetical protein